MEVTEEIALLICCPARGPHNNGVETPRLLESHKKVSRISLRIKGAPTDDDAKVHRQLRVIAAQADISATYRSGKVKEYGPARRELEPCQDISAFREVRDTLASKNACYSIHSSVSHNICCRA